jgi:chemotaxis protein CheD
LKPSWASWSSLMSAHPNRINIIQGEYQVSDDSEAVIATLVGSCVAACMYDPVLRVGGMNHFLLPGEAGGANSAQAERMGVHLMELLVNGLLKLGASRQNLQAKLFGGANTVRGLGSIGSNNAKFAKEFLARERIACVGGSLGGERGRRVQFWPSTGKAMQMLVAGAEVAALEVAKPVASQSSGDLELF